MFFQTVFWGKGLPHHFSVTLLRQSCPALCVFGGGQAGLHGNQFFELLFPCSFPPLLPGSEQKWLHPNLCPEQKNRILFLSLNPPKQSLFLYVSLKSTASHSAYPQRLCQRSSQGPRHVLALCVSKTASSPSPSLTRTPAAPRILPELF